MSLQRPFPVRAAIFTLRFSAITTETSAFMTNHIGRRVSVLVTSKLITKADSVIQDHDTTVLALTLPGLKDGIVWGLEQLLQHLFTLP